MIQKMVIAVMVMLSASSAVAQDAQKGERSFSKCLACHAIGPRTEAKIGPQLNGLDGRRAGAVPNFTYSDGIKKAGIVWTEESFREFMRNPATRVPGNKMAFPGIKSDQESSDLWAYIKKFSAEGGAK